MTHLFDSLLPKVSIVSSNYNKQNQIKFFLESIFRQTYAGVIELVLVDDFSKDITMKVVEEYIPILKMIYPSKSINVITIKNKMNVGNCTSRNQGIERSTGEILIITDSDCLLSKNFVESYVQTYIKEKSDVVVSDFGIELRNRNPMRTLELYEENPLFVKRDLKVQDPLFPSSFLNTVTRGFSIRKSFINKDLYDKNFNYTNSPESGFGWEDIEAGYTLHKQGANISYTNNAFTIHITHKSTAENADKSLKLLKNYRKLHEKHPEIVSLKKDWSVKTYEKILRQQQVTHHLKNEDNLFLEKHLNITSFSPFFKLLITFKKFIQKDLKFNTSRKTFRSPDFLIIGTIKGGTSSLYSYLGKHPDICRAYSKELNYFSDYYDNGDEWYMNQFPALINYYEGIITGEATPTYLERPDAAKRAYYTMPHAKIILLLRNPIDRAYSNYQMLIRNKKINISFEELIENEKTDMRTNYLDRGKYAQHLSNWFHFFPPQQIMIIRSEDFEKNPEKYFLQVQDFLQVPRYTIPSYSKINTHKTNYPPMNDTTRAHLIEYYRPHNEVLEKLLNRRFFWDY